MNRKYLILLLIVISSAILFGETKTVGLVYDRATGVNRHAAQFILQNRRILGNVQLQPIDASQPASPGRIDLFVLLNTGVASGLDPVLSGYEDKLPAGAKVIRLNLYRGKPVSDVITSNEDGVDAITSASVWGGRQARRMHDQWIQALSGILNN